MMEEKLTFKEKIARLDQIVQDMSSLSLPLDESIELYEEGSLLIKELEDELTESEKKVENIVDINKN